MPETRPDLPSQPPVPQGADPITSLHKMSTTAGLGTTEYVAINGAAVTAAILGVASSLAILAGVLLAIPVVAIIFAVVALRQIGKSSGTQGGRGLAWGGLALALIFGGVVVGGEVHQVLGHREDQRQFLAIVSQLEQDIKKDDSAAAYTLFSPQFQQRVDKSRFASTMGFLHKHPMYGDLEYLQWNNVPFQFESLPNDAARYATGTFLMKMSQKMADPMRVEMTFRDDGQGWHIYNIPSVFAEQPAGK